MPEANIVVHTIGDAIVVNFSDTAILDAPAIEAVGKRLYELVDQQAQRKIILDFARVRHLSSLLLGVLIQLQKKSAAIHGRVAICSLRPELQKVFKITQLEKFFGFYEGEQAALDGLGAK